MVARWKKVIEDLKGYHSQRIILFGSGARGESDEYSDLDIIVIKETDKRFLERIVEAARLIRPELHPIDIFVYTPEEFKEMKKENPFIRQALKEGKVIYEESKRRKPKMVSPGRA